MKKFFLFFFSFGWNFQLQNKILKIQNSGREKKKEISYEVNEGKKKGKRKKMRKNKEKK